MSQHVDRATRLNQIREVIANHPHIKMGEIARQLKMSKSPHLIGLVSELYDAGEVSFTESPMGNGLIVRKFILTAHAQQLPLPIHSADYDNNSENDRNW